MCGIFGITVKDTGKIKKDEIRGIADILFKLSESRGKEAAGLAVRMENAGRVLKSPVKASDFLKTAAYKKFWDGVDDTPGFLAVIGHSRLATHGTEYKSGNNQPVIKENLVCIHNGIIANDSDLWKNFFSLKRKSEVDTEVFLAMLNMFLEKGASLSAAVKKVFDEIEGSASVAILFNNSPSLLLATNTGSLYLCVSDNGQAIVFGSENYILEEFIKKSKNVIFKPENINQIKPWTGIIFDLATMSRSDFDFSEKSPEVKFTPSLEVNFIDFSDKEFPVLSLLKISSNQYKLFPETRKSMMETWERIYSREGLRRCTKCLYPETMPFIDFDENGVCNYCRNHKKTEVKGHDELEKIVSKYRRADGKPDCIVPFSGGRDSSYGLYYIKKVLKMNPIAYTYDWGVMTDLGRRNEARMCGKLGVEHIIISADIRRKRENIRKNLNTWLKRPELGMVPLFMAGDKQVLYYAQWLRKKMNTELVIYSATDNLEEEPFKIGFCGIPRYDILPPKYYSLLSRLQTAKYYIPQYFLNPAYFNSSFFDSLFAFYSYFILREKSHLKLFNYIKWEEKEILKTIIDEYGWEVEEDTKATWRIDDGTTPFYNYIYMTVAGFTEFDTFRSAQIRERQLDRETAYKLIKEENKPRFESLEWYARTIGFDINKAIKVINAIPKLYKYQK